MSSRRHEVEEEEKDKREREGTVKS